MRTRRTVDPENAWASLTASSSERPRLIYGKLNGLPRRLDLRRRNRNTPQPRDKELRLNIKSRRLLSVRNMT